jgi:hypothetical protein
MFEVSRNFIDCNFENSMYCSRCKNKQVIYFFICYVVINSLNIVLINSLLTEYFKIRFGYQYFELFWLSRIVYHILQYTYAQGVVICASYSCLAAALYVI